MRACLLHAQAPASSHPLRVEEIAAPVPGPGELLIDVTACGVCRTDLHVVEGDLPLEMRPTIPGHQVVGRVAATTGPEGPAVGQRVGVAWLHRTCGRCRFCQSGRENLCEAALFTGWTARGGFASQIAAPAAFVYALPDGMSDVQIAPLLCAGIIGYRALRLTGLSSWSGARVGLYGFGAAGHLAIQIARARGAEVYVCTRDRQRHQALASELGARWVGGAMDRPPVALDAAIVFAPAGEIVVAALEALDAGGTVVLGGIHMSPIPSLPYPLLYRERVVRSVANNTRADGRDMLAEASRIAGLTTHVEVFPLAAANEALARLANDAIRGAAVLTP